MDTVSLETQARSADEKAADVRRAGNVPCVLYGNDVENTSLQCAHNELYRAYAAAGESTIVELDAAGKKVPVLFQAIDFHPVNDKILHVDFYAVDMNKEIEAQIPIHFIGTAPAVKDLGGVLITSHDHVKVRCLPANLPHSIDVSIEGLETFEHSVHISDIAAIDGVEILDDESIVLATVSQPRQVVESTEEEEGAAEGEEGAEEGGSEEGGDAEGGDE